MQVAGRQLPVEFAQIGNSLRMPGRDQLVGLQRGQKTKRKGAPVNNRLRPKAREMRMVDQRLKRGLGRRGLKVMSALLGMVGAAARSLFVHSSHSLLQLMTSCSRAPAASSESHRNERMCGLIYELLEDNEHSAPKDQ